eukprot:9503110-Pyramimonas_sp.AAC.1
MSCARPGRTTAPLFQKHTVCTSRAGGPAGVAACAACACACASSCNPPACRRLSRPPPSAFPSYSKTGRPADQHPRRRRTRAFGSSSAAERQGEARGGI